MRNNISKIASFQKQQGAALFVALIMLIALTIIGLTATQRSNLQEKMAANTHQLNSTFNAAESAIGAFLTEANTGNRVNDPNHLIVKLRASGVLGPFCVDETGNRAACGTNVKLDHAKALESRYTARVVGQCSVAQCGGHSFGLGNGCRIFRVDSAGTVGGEYQAAGTQSSESTFWAYEVTACL